MKKVEGRGWKIENRDRPLKRLSSLSGEFANSILRAESSRFYERHGSLRSAPPTILPAPEGQGNGEHFFPSCDEQ
jgi:hypothetical protein